MARLLSLHRFLVLVGRVWGPRSSLFCLRARVQTHDICITLCAHMKCAAVQRREWRAQPDANVSRMMCLNRRLLVPKPSIDEQAAIASVLDAVDAAIDKARETLGRARDAERALIADAFDRMDAQTRKLGEFSTDVRYGTSQASSERGWGNPVLRIPNVVGDQLTLDDLAYVDLRPVDVDRLALSDGDLLLVRTNGNPRLRWSVGSVSSSR